MSAFIARHHRVPRLAAGGRRRGAGFRAGFALLTAVVAISLVGVLALASTRLALGRITGARRVTAVLEAALDAQRLLDSTGAAARPARWDAMPRGVPTTLRDLPGRERMVVTRVGDLLYRLDAGVERGDGVTPVRRAESLLLRADPPRLDRGAPLVASGAVAVARDFVITSAGDGVCARSADAADIVAADTTRVRWESPSGSARVVEEAALRAPDAFQRDASRIRAVAELVLAGGAAWAPSADSVVVVVSSGDLALGPGQGRGTVLVEGTLTLVGPVRWEGVLLALGGVVTSGTGVEVIGTLTSGGDVQLAGGTLRHDACVARAAALGAARFGPVREWSRATLP